MIDKCKYGMKPLSLRGKRTNSKGKGVFRLTTLNGKVLTRETNIALIFCSILLLLSVEIAYSVEPVIIEFLYYYDPCPTCPNDLYFYNTKVVDSIESDYGNNVSVIRIPFYSVEGEEKRKLYDIKVWEQNAIVINREVVITGYANETYIREYIDYFLGLRSSPPTPPQQPSFPTQLNLPALLALSFTFGFFETFSPCLIAMLSFVLSYTITELSSFREKFSQVMVFGAGFVIATFLMFTVTAAGIISVAAMLRMQHVLMWIICAFAILFGLDLLGFNIFKIFKIKVETKPLIQRLTKKYALTYTGLTVLGFLFYFLDPCIAPVFVVMLTASQQALLPEFLLLVLLTFCLGVTIPFIGIGFLSGSISKLVRSTYRHRFKLRAISGVILICYALYLIISYLPRTF
jgi:cytochrome c biogenesis protein CcdA